MKAIFNGEILDWEKIRLSPQNRGFKYGDGIFETIALINDVPWLLDRHLERLTNGAKILFLDTHKILDPKQIPSQVKQLQKANNIGPTAKLRLYLWRNSEGLYTPKTNDTAYLLTIEKMNAKRISILEKVGYSENAINYPSPYSQFKTLNALKYVIAGIEKINKGLDEIILKDYTGSISEALSSNLFWKKGDSYFTAPLTTGCIDGIMRNWLIKELKLRSYKVEEKLINSSELSLSDHIFTTNSLGIGHIQELSGNVFDVDPLVQEIIESRGID